MEVVSHKYYVEVENQVNMEEELSVSLKELVVEKTWESYLQDTRKKQKHKSIHAPTSMDLYFIRRLWHLVIVTSDTSQTTAICFLVKLSFLLTQ